MKTVKTPNGNFELSNEQYELCSWIATKAKEKPSDANNNKLFGLKTGAIIFNVPNEVIYDIEINKNYSQYRNVYKLTTFELL